MTEKLELNALYLCVKMCIRDRGMKEDKASWVSFFQWLRGRGLDGVKPVSYTHLDVYKRQELYTVQAASAQPLEEIDPAGLVLLHALGGAQNLTKTVLIHGDCHQNGYIFVLSAPVAAQVDAVHIDVWIAPAL